MTAEPAAPERHGARIAARTVRVRTTLEAVLVVGIALLLTATSIVVLLRRALTEDVRTAARFRAETVLDVLASGSDVDQIRIGDIEEEFVQVLDPSGRVVVSSSNVEGDPPLTRPAPGQNAEVEVPFEDDPFLAVATRGVASEETYTVVVGRTLETVLESSRVVVNLLLIGLPLLLVIVAAVTWVVVGRALAPVESIRTEVEAISAEQLHRRVPDPGSGDEIARLAATMNRMLERLESGQARQRRFVSDASHELRSPIATIRQHAEVAAAHTSTASVEELSQIVLGENRRLQRLVEDLLLLARMDERIAPARLEVLDLDDVVFEGIERVRRGSDNKTIDAGAISAGRVLGDRIQLSKLVLNLLDNALRHARTSVVVSLRERGDEVVLTVDDDGAGIPPGDRSRIFERFVRLNEARDRDSGGSGLGLAIVAEVAAVHGGAARALASDLGGARLEVRIPRARD